MNDKLLKIYHRLPGSARSFAASLRGLYLRSWRYGPETERLVYEALERDRWPQERWKNWQEERLAFVLRRAATQVPFYREQWLARRRKGDQSSYEDIDNWPILEKESVRANPTAFVAEDCNTRMMFCEHTSGTTGKSLNLWWRRETVRAWFALFEARVRIWNGVSRHDNWAILGGQPVTSPNTKRPPFWVWNAPMNQLYLSANHISRQSISAYRDAMSDYNVTHLVAYSSSASFLAREIVEQDGRMSGLKAVITNAEPLLPWQRDIIKRGLSCEVRETYGMAEIVAGASECPSGTRHLWPEVGRLEILSDKEDVAVKQGETGRFICTGLLNADMPLIRYAVGDRGRIAKEQYRCTCGRMLPAIDSIEGRCNDMLIAPDGRRVYWLNPVFYNTPVREAQIIQEKIDSIKVRYVPAPEFSSEVGLLIRERLQSRMGAVKVVLEQVESIPRGVNGKFRSIICNISNPQRN